MAQPPAHLLEEIKPTWVGYFVNYEEKWTRLKGCKRGILSAFEDMEKLAKLKARIEETLNAEGLTTALYKEMESLLKQLVDISNAMHQIMRILLKQSIVENPPGPGSVSVDVVVGTAAGEQVTASVETEQTNEMDALKQAMSKLNLNDDTPVPRCKNGVVDMTKNIGEVHTTIDLVKLLTAKVNKLIEETEELLLKATAMITLAPPQYLLGLIQQGENPHQALLDYHQQFMNPMPIEERATAEIPRGNENHIARRREMVPRDELLAEEEE